MNAPLSERTENSTEDLVDRDLVMLQAFSRRPAYWTTELALLAGHHSTREAYVALERLEERHLVERIVRLDPTSWRRTGLGDIISDLSSFLRQQNAAG